MNVKDYLRKDQHQNLADEIVKVTQFLRSNNLIFNNSSSIDSKGNKAVISSTFVGALSGLLLQLNANHPIVQMRLSELTDYLLGQLDLNGLLKFYSDRECPYDLDTTAVGYHFLIDRIKSRGEIHRIRKVFMRNKCKETGAYRTWINRPNNNIDYMVNINIYTLFQRCGIHDSSLERYLIQNVNKFINNGSHYYKCIEFPLFLISFYKSQNLRLNNNRLILKLISDSRNTILRQYIFRLKDTYSRQKHESIDRDLTFQQYFNSSSKSFHSKLLDLTINSFFKTRKNRFIEPLMYDRLNSTLQ